MAGKNIGIHQDTWKDRCQDIHGLHRGQDAYHSNKDDILTIVKFYYSNSYLLSYHDRKWLGRDINQFQQMNEQSILPWIKVAKTLISNNKRHQSKRKQNTITKYFNQFTSTSPTNATALDKRFHPNTTPNLTSFIGSSNPNTPPATVTLATMRNVATNPTYIVKTNRIVLNIDSDQELSRYNHILNVTKDATEFGSVHILNNKHQKGTSLMFEDSPKSFEPTILDTPPMNTNSEETVMVVYHNSTRTQHTHITSKTSNISSTTPTTYTILSSPVPKPLAKHTQ